MGLFSYKEKRYGKATLRIFALLLIVVGAALIAGGICAVVFMEHWSRFIIVSVACVVGLFPIFIGLYIIAVSFSMISSWKSGRDGNHSKGVSNTRLCDKCGRVITKRAEFCEHCGVQQETGLGLKSCPKCKTKNSGEADFCEKCGEKFE